jgi:hypothetical protein
MTALLSSFGAIKCAASDARLAEPWPDYAVENRRAFEGDLILVEVLSSSGAYNDVENLQGRSERVYAGDLFIGVLGNRASLRYLSGSIPLDGIDLTSETDLRLLSNGGIVSIADRSPAYLDEPMPLRSLGVLVEGTETVNTLQRARAADSPTPSRLPPIVLVGASATDSGKTTFASNLIASLTRSGVRVASAKLSGTGCLEDVLAHKDAGARWIMDFPDVGLPSTYTSPQNYEPAVRDLLSRLAAVDPDVVVAELGGDILWANVPTLFQMADVMESVQSLVLIPSDPVAAVGARSLLDGWGVTAPVTWVIPPSRNPTTYRARMDAFVAGKVIDTRSAADIEAFAQQLRDGWGDRK